MAEQNAKLSKEVVALIEANLPELSAAELRRVLNEGEKAKKDVKRIEKQSNTAIEGFEEQIGELKESLAFAEKLNTDAQEKIAELQVIADRVEAIEIREREMDVRAANASAHNAHERADEIKELVRIVFGHPSVTVTRNRDVVTSNEYGPVTTPTIETETHTTEKT